jgi:hypothetical protein
VVNKKDGIRFEFHLYERPDKNFPEFLCSVKIKTNFRPLFYRIEIQMIGVFYICYVCPILGAISFYLRI